MLDPSQAMSGLSSFNALFTFAPRFTGVLHAPASDARLVIHKS
jgi:hypothetical protein